MAFSSEEAAYGDVAGVWGRWPAAGAAATGRQVPGSGGLDPREDEVAVRAREDRLAHLVGVVAHVDEVLVHRDVPGVLRDGAVEVGQRLLLRVTRRTQRGTERGLDVRLLGALRVHEAAVEDAGHEPGRLPADREGPEEDRV